MKITSALLNFWQGIPGNRKHRSRNKRMALESLDARITPSVVPVSGNPWGMVTGDFNRDGRVDIVTTASQFSGSSGSNTVSVLLNSPNGAYERADYAVGFNPVAVATGDLNRDGNTDLVVSNLYSPSVSVLLGNGDGTFRPQMTTGLRTQAMDLVLGDFNRDGILDLATANVQAATVSVMRGLGNGTFASPVDYQTPARPYKLVAADLDRDGNIDLSVASDGAGGVAVLMGSWNGTFSAARHYRPGYLAYKIAAADMNADGFTDLILSGPSNNVVYLQNNRKGTFGSGMVIAAGNATNGLAVGDVNRDGRPDIVVANYNDKKVSVILNQGGGRFASPVSYSVGLYPWTVSLADFDGDGFVDIACANSALSANIAYAKGSVSILHGTGSGAFLNQKAKTVVPVSWNPWGMVTGDFNRDGRVDIVTTGSQFSGSSGSNTVSVLLNSPNGAYERADYAVGFNPIAVATGDLNRDGNTDLVVSNLYSPSVSVLLGNGDGTFRPQMTTGLRTQAMDLVLGDFNRDGILDLATANVQAATVSVMRGLGNGTFASPVDYQTPARPNKLAIADLNRDGYLDIAASSDGAGGAVVLMGTRTGTFSAAIHYRAGYLAYKIAAADMNGDGFTDLLLSGPSNNVVYLQNNRNGTFGSGVIIAAGNSTNGLAVGDVNRDGRPDIVVANYNEKKVSVIRNLGYSRFASPVSYSVGLYPWAVSLADFDGDGFVDIACANSALSANIAYAKGSVSILHGNASGTFMI